MNVHELLARIGSKPEGRRLTLTITSTGAVRLKLDVGGEVGTIAVDDEGRVKYVLLKEDAPIWVLRRLERHAPEITVK